MSFSGKFILLLPPMAAAIIDAIFTLNGQADGYWSGTVGSIRESNPIAYYFLSVSPVTFIAGIAVWIIAVCFALLVLHYRIARWVSLAICLSHLFGAATWIIQLKHGVLWVVLLCIAARIVVHPIYYRKRQVASSDGTLRCGT